MDDGWGILFMAAFSFFVLWVLSKSDKDNKKKPKEK